MEIDKYCQKVLRKHWPDVPIIEDIRDVEKIKGIVANATGEGCLEKQLEAGIPSQTIREAPAGESSRASSMAGTGEVEEVLTNAENREQSQFTAGDSGYEGRGQAQERLVVGASDRSRDGDIAEGIRNRTGIATSIQTSVSESPAILITAGFPCQPFSVAGKRGSKEDDRYLWPETLTVIKAVKPTWILLENVTGIINLALDTVLSDLEGASYSTETLIIPACAVNAWHRRDRVWIVGFTNELRLQEQRIRPMDNESQQPGQDVADTQTAGLDGSNTKGNLCPAGCLTKSGQGRRQADWRAVESGFCRVADGLPSGLDGYFDREPDIPRVATGIKNRVDRLKCLGNAIVPQIAYEIIKVIVEQQ